MLQEFQILLDTLDMTGDGRTLILRFNFTLKLLFSVTVITFS